MMPQPNPYTKPYHKAALISERGVSALCFKSPRAINLKRALWGESHTDEEFKALAESYTGEDFDSYKIDAHERYTFESPEVG